MQQEISFSKKFSFSVEALLPWIIFATASAFYCYEFLLRILPSVMINDLMSSFHINASLLGNLLAYYYYVYAPMQLPVGVLMDRYKPRNLLVFSCLICALGALCFAYSSHIFIIGFARALMGFGSAFAFIGVLKLASIWLPEKYFAVSTGVAMSLGLVGAILGNNIMADLVKETGWENAFFYVAIVGLVLSALLYLVMRDSPAPHSKTPSQNATEKSTFKKLWPNIILLLKNPLVWLNGCLGGLLYLPISAFAALWGIPFIQNAYHVNTQTAASLVSTVFLGMAICSPFAGWLSTRINTYILIGGGAILSGLIITIIVFVPNLSNNILYLTLFLWGVLASVQILVFPIVKNLASQSLAGTAVACTNMLIMWIGALYQSIIGYLLDFTWNGLKINDHPVYSALDYKNALCILPISLFLAAILTFFLYYLQKKNTTKS